MKKLFALLLCLSLCAALFTAGSPAFAEEAERETFTFINFEYVLLDDGTAELTKYVGKADALTIPDALGSHAVTSIGDQAFSGCYKLTSVTIPDSVTSVGANCFASCVKLSAVKVSPDHPTLAVIDGVLFSKADKRLVCYPRALIAESYSIPQGTKSIGDQAFFGCKNLTSVTIPDSVTSIGDQAFFSCRSLSSVTIPNSVTSIVDWTFSGCSSLSSVTIPDSVTSIGVAAFSWCARLTSVTIPDSVTFIDDQAFYYCVSLTSVIIPDSVTSIGDQAFFGCASLASVTIPDSVTSIGANPFVHCDKLSAIKVSPDHPALAVIDGVLFSKTDKCLVCYPYAFTASSYSIPQGIESIGDLAFAFCGGLRSVTIPDSVTYIGDEAFSYCGSLTLTVWRDSYAKKYCSESGLNYTYADASDWLNG